MRLALQHQHIAAALLREMVGDARSNDAATDDHHLRSPHEDLIVAKGARLDPGTSFRAEPPLPLFWFGARPPLPLGDLIAEKLAKLIDLRRHSALEGFLVDPDSAPGIGPKSVPVAAGIAAAFRVVTGDQVAAGAPERTPGALWRQRREHLVCARGVHRLEAIENAVELIDAVIVRFFAHSHPLVVARGPRHAPQDTDQSLH